ncbi:hypothetical protein ACJ41O_006005 [Fusarium nematophilum]
MKLDLTLLRLCFLSSVAASPYTSPNEPVGLEARGGKCAYKNKRCCAYPDDDYEYKGHGDDYGGDHYGYSRTIHVRPGKRIQRAIDKAHPGDTIVVEAGTYKEQLTISKDGIELVGHGAILEPPAKVVNNKCSGLSGPNTEAGICISGHGIVLDKFIVEHRKVRSVKKPVKDVSVTGFEVRKFSGVNIVVLGAKNARVIKNKLVDSAKYGSLTLGSYNTLIHDNVVKGRAVANIENFIGICMDNFSGVTVSKNKISTYFIGLCVQTNGADVQYNTVRDVCSGIFIDPFVQGAKIRHNSVGPPNAACAGLGGSSGIVIDGAVRTLVKDNLVEGQKAGDKGVGIIVSDDECPLEGPNVSLSCIVNGGKKAIARDNVVIKNTLRNNDYDFFVPTKGTNNLIACNNCKDGGKACVK